MISFLNVHPLGAIILLFLMGNMQAQQAGSRLGQAIQVDSKPQIDGKLDDPVWDRVPAIRDFVQHEPREGDPATEVTEVRIVYDTNNLYVAVWCHDREPSKILVTESRRDSDLTNTDSFRMIFDTYLDHQNAFVFGTNPLGIQFDGQVSNDGQESGGGVAAPGTIVQRGTGSGFNKNWDGNWTVKTEINENGWTAEFEIPLNTLRYKRGTPQIWGVNFARNIRRKNEQDYWSLVPRQWDLYRVSLAGELRGLELESPTNLKLTPYVLGSIQRDFENEPLEQATKKVDGGIDAKYGITPNLTLDLTYNTDFAQVEVDEQQVNLTRFSLFFPEKRPFFLENAGFFAVGSPRQAELFFSRRIGLDESGEIIPILGGARLSGRVGQWDLGLLNIQTETVGDCSRAAPQTESRCVAAANNFTVTRLSRQFGKHSSAGGLFINKSVTDSGLSGDEYNRTFALDGRWGVGDAFLASGFLAKTSTFRDGESRSEERDHAYQVQAEYRRRTYGFRGGFIEVGDDFNPEVGFLTRKAYRSFTGNINTFIRVPSVGWLRELRPHLTWRVFRDFEGFKEDETVHMDTHLEWENGTFFSPAVDIIEQGLQEPFEIFPGVLVPPGSYRHPVLAWRFNSNLSAPFSVSARVDAGGFYSGSLRSYNITLNARYGPRLSGSFDYTRNLVRLPVEGPNGEFGGDFKTNLAKIRVNYSFTPRIFVQSLMQYNDAGDNWSLNLRFGWLNVAGTGWFVVYTETRDLEDIDLGSRLGFPSGEPLSRSLFVKFTREFSLFK